MFNQPDISTLIGLDCSPGFFPLLKAKLIYRIVMGLRLYVCVRVCGVCAYVNPWQVGLNITQKYTVVLLQTYQGNHL